LLRRRTKLRLLHLLCRRGREWWRWKGEGDELVEIRSRGERGGRIAGDEEKGRGRRVEVEGIEG
jgi:hypothetical protein